MIGEFGLQNTLCHVILQLLVKAGRTEKVFGIDALLEKFANEPILLGSCLLSATAHHYYH
jgi:hypothetical protein